MNGRKVAVLEADPLRAVLALESGGDPTAVVPAYAAALRRLADAVATPDVLANFADWLLDALELVPPSGEWATWREARWDAAVDVTADSVELAAFFRRTADHVQAQPPRRLHLLSLLRAKIVWRARDKMRKHQLGQDRQVEVAPGLASTDPQARCIARLVVARMEASLEHPPQVQQALAALLSGESVSEAAKTSGLSRQAIYRALARIREWAEEAR